MKKILLLILALVALVLAPTACSPADLLQGTPAPGSAAEIEAMEREHQERQMEMRKSLPGTFEINFHDYSGDSHFIDYDDSCRNSAPYLAADGDAGYVGMVFASQLLQTETISETEATATFLLTLSTVNVENHVVNIADQTVKFDGEEAPGQALDPQLWIDRANQLNSTILPTTITVKYTPNELFDPESDSQSDFIQPYEWSYWKSTSATCTTTNP